MNSITYPLSKDAAPPTRSLRILLVDDSEDERLLLEDELHQEGYDPMIRRVETAETMQAALSEEEWDLLIVDYVMPRFSGLAALELYRRLELDLPVIVLSGQMGEETAVEVMRAGAKDYIIKQNRSRLFPAIARELGEYQDRLARREAEQKLGIIAKSAHDAIVMWDSEGLIKFWNPAATRIFGWDEEAVIGVDIEQILIPVEDRKTAAKRFSFLATAPGEMIGKTIELSALHKQGRQFPIELSLSTFHSHGAQGTIGIARDISDRKRMEQALEKLATHDSLTGFYNRTELETQLRNELNRALRHQRPLSVFFLDLDHFKRINDRFGHQTGDELLQSFADLLRRAVRNVDYIGRYGGEEFVVILPETPPRQALEIAKRLVESVMAYRFDTSGEKSMTLTVSIGISALPEHSITVEGLIKAADKAMYAAKRAGRNRACLAESTDR